MRRDTSTLQVDSNIYQNLIMAGRNLSFEDRAYREAVANMLVHRDYAMDVDARIEIFSDRIEIISPGGLPLGILHEEFVEGRISKARNKKVSDVFLRLRIIERLATGIRRIKEQYMDYEVKPKFLTTEHAVVIILPFIQQSELNSMVEITVMETDFDQIDEMIYLLIKKNPMIKRADIQKQIQLEKSQTIERINRLKKSGKIMTVGNGPATGYKVLA